MSYRLNENWFSEEDFSYLSVYIRKAQERAEGRGDPSPLFIEEGCWEGRSAIRIAAAIDPIVLECCDTWVPDGHQSIKSIEGRDILENFKHNMAVKGQTNYRVFQMDAHDYEDILLERGQPISFIHIDACHQREFVATTLKKLKPLFRDFSLVCGHDANYRPIKDGVNDAGFETKIHGRIWVITNPVPSEP